MRARPTRIMSTNKLKKTAATYPASVGWIKKDIRVQDKDVIEQGYGTEALMTQRSF